jgi:hydroxyacyl-ACP dehydratase HTD2-like protein with hotdog domain
VHGPLNLISMLDYWRDVHGQENLGEISYRAMSPLYAGDVYHIRTTNVTDVDDRRQWELLVEKDGVLCMKGSIQGM